jgi:cyanophycinase
MNAMIYSCVKRNMKSTLILLSLLLVGCISNPLQNDSEFEQNRPGSIGLVGNPEDISTDHENLIVLGGGGLDQDDAMRRMVEAARGGNISVLRATGSSAYNPYFFGLTSVGSVETFRIDSQIRASNERTNTLIRNSEVIFVAGGDQYDYARFWTNSTMESTIREMVETKKITFGGTSAGAMIWGGSYYDAIFGTLTGQDAMLNPLDPRISLRPGLFGSHPFLRDRIIDTHFRQRNREGRLMTFIAKAGYQQYSGIGIDEETALIIDENGIATAYGVGFVWMYLPQNGFPPEILQNGRPLTWDHQRRAVRVWKLGNSERFDMNTNRPLDRPAGYYAFVQEGTFTIEADDE